MLSVHVHKYRITVCNFEYNFYIIRLSGKSENQRLSIELYYVTGNNIR